MNYKQITITIILLITGLFAACKDSQADELITKDDTDKNGQSIETLSELYDVTAADCNVIPIDNINTFTQEYLNNYIRGVDISSIIEVENAGGKFYDNDGYRVSDVLELLSCYGINWVRIRLWNDPYSIEGKPYGGGTNDLTKAIEISRRAKKWGMKVLLNFHYSDFWTHPGQQVIPKDWVKYATIDERVSALKQYTKDVLTQMFINDVLPDMVQVGNETNWGFCGVLDDGPLNNTRPNEKKLLSAGLEAVREINEQYSASIRTMLHAAGTMGTIDWWFNIMQTLDFDIIGISFYPQYNHGTRTDLQNGLLSLTGKYRKPICVVEYSVSYTERGGEPYAFNMYGESNSIVRTFIDTGTDRTIAGQAQVIRNLNNDIMNYAAADGNQYGIGSFWWEAAWLPLQGTAWAFPASSEWYQMGLPGSDSEASNNPGENPRVSWANQAFFSFEGTVLPSVNAFLQMMGKPAR